MKTVVSSGDGLTDGGTVVEAGYMSSGAIPPASCYFYCFLLLLLEGGPKI